MRVGVITFLGSNCDDDALYAFGEVLGAETKRLFYYETSLPSLDLVVLPGGFSYGDYLRAGAIARFSPIMSAVKEFADSGGLVLGICNGFQILCEAGLLPGALVKNAKPGFWNKWVNIRVENEKTFLTSGIERGEVLKIPIAHAEGNFVAPSDTIKEIEEKGCVVFRYCDESGKLTEEANPNGSINNIAGIINFAGNVLGMMPHPERACEEILGSTDGLKLLKAFSGYLTMRQVRG